MQLLADYLSRFVETLKSMGALIPALAALAIATAGPIDRYRKRPRIKLEHRGQEKGYVVPWQNGLDFRLRIVNKGSTAARDIKVRVESARYNLLKNVRAGEQYTT
jgi:hypothetical protein